MGIILPTREEVERWIASEDGRTVNETFRDIDAFNHGTVKAWMVDIDFDRSPSALKSLQRRLSEQLPIDDIRHAAYIFEEDLLVTSEKNEYLLQRSVLDVKLERIDNFINYHSVLGMTAIVKSNGWRIFDTVGIHRDIDHIRRYGEGLAKKGYVVLFMDYRDRHGVYASELLRPRDPFLVPVFT